MFNKAALERLRSPEKLDTAVSITRPIAWMGLAAISGSVIHAGDLIANMDRPEQKADTSRPQRVNGRSLYSG